MDQEAINSFLVWSILAIGTIFVGASTIILCGVGACVLAALYSFGCLTCPQHENNDIPMDIIQADLETAGADADLAEAI